MVAPQPAQKAPPKNDNSLFEDLVAGAFKYFVRHWGWTVPAALVLIALFATRDWGTALLLWFLAFVVIGLRLFIPWRRGKKTSDAFEHLHPDHRRIAATIWHRWPSCAAAVGLAVPYVDARGNEKVDLPRLEPLGFQTVRTGLEIMMWPIPGIQSASDLVAEAHHIASAWYVPEAAFRSEVRGIAAVFTIVMADPLAGTRHTGPAADGQPQAPTEGIRPDQTEPPHW